MPTLTIDGQTIDVEPGTTIIQACELLNIEIPRFCYHSRLKISGNCRMCLVEVEKIPKPVASCAYPASDNMVVHTNSPIVKHAREGVLEFLLINHPLDCPICDEAGECDLQDQTMAYGRTNSRYEEEKRAIVEKNFSPLIKTAMTRCIHCTRCVRFISDVAGVAELGAIYRGEETEITTYIEKSVLSELSGNIIDLCPVGALTSKPYAFKARSWELTKTESIDVLDAVGSNIRIDSRGQQVMRILPRLNEDINEEWISDKTRFACDGLAKQRLEHPYIRDKHGKLNKASWTQAFELIAKKLEKLSGDKIAAIAGDLIDVEAMLALKDLWQKLGSNHLDSRQNNEKLSNDNRSDYLFNTSIAGIEKADFCLIIGANPRKDAAILNARIRKACVTGKLKVALLGSKADLTYKYNYLGDQLKTLEEILKGAHLIADELKKAQNPMLILGNQLISLADGADIITLAKLIAEKYQMISKDWNGFNILHTAAARVGGLDIGFIPGKNGYALEQILQKCEEGKIELVYLLGSDEIDLTKIKNAFVIYQGSHGDKAAHIADIILPGCTYTEKEATYVNLEGRVQRTYKAVNAPGDAKLDWQIIVELAKFLNQDLGYQDLKTIRQKMVAYAPHFGFIDKIISADFEIKTRDYNCNTKTISYNDVNYYLTNPICRASVTMAKCAKGLNT